MEKFHKVQINILLIVFNMSGGFQLQCITSGIISVKEWLVVNLIYSNTIAVDLPS